MRKISVLALLALTLCATLVYGLTSVVICSEHGVKAVYTGNRKTLQRKSYCEYSHPTRLSTHKFWSECD